MWLRRNKWKIIVPVLAVAVLVFAFWYGGDAPGMQGWTITDTAAPEGGLLQQDGLPDTQVYDEDGVREEAQTDDNTYGSPVTGSDTDPSLPSLTPELDLLPESVGSDSVNGDQQTVKPEDVETDLESRPGGADGGLTADEKQMMAAQMGGSSGQSGDAEYSQQHGMELDPVTGKDQYLTSAVPEGKPVPVEPQDVTISNVAHTCTLTIRCSTILQNISWLDPEKIELVPADGIIYATTTVTFYEGESVFNVLQRELKRNGIHFEFQNTPIYNSAYIEGIGNLYEFDCGDLSGWVYSVNDWFPNYGCSRYQLRQGDNIVWQYTCNLGVDVGGHNNA